MQTLALGSHYGQYQQSQYDRNNLVALPSQLLSYVLTGDVEVAKDGSASGRSAVIQAGGNVSISATQDLTNSVIHQDYGFSAGANKVQTTQVAGTGAPVVVRINAQLPPNLAQQQVNPLALPGFSLPTGQNGLFRLSGQGGSVRQASQANLGSQNWSMGGAAVSTAQRQQGLPEVQARHFQIDDLSPVAASDRQLTQTTRQATGSSVGASVINVAAPVDTGSNVTQLPGYISSASAITQPGTVQVDAAHQPVAVVVPGVTPTLPVTQRDPLIPAITPGISTLARVQGLPDMSVRSNPQKYLVETNPVLTDLKQFMSSDYLLSGLGYNPDTSAKRLGDGFYEQKLIQQAVVARTGQRFIDGQTSNEKLFKYLMDNAISSKQQLNLSVGVSLTSEQVAALTHDIVWMEKQVVNGEEVLVPVLYLAQATNRLAPNGALIQGTDVTLIAGANLENSGTLRASNNLKATAGNDLVNTGLIEAGNRLDLLAGNNIVNKSGGIIAGRDVNVTAVTGDVLNQRDVNRSDQTAGFVSAHRESLDNAARIEAANNLSLKAGRDVENNGSVLQSGGDTRINAGRDIDIAATESRSSTNYYGRGANDSSVTQTGATVSAGRDLQMTAGRDLTAIASQIDAKRDISMAATENLTLASAADEQHSYSNSRRVTSQEDHTRQVSTGVTAGGNIAVSAGNDLGLIASKISAGNEAYVYAGKDLNLLSAENTDYSYYSRTKKGSWGRKSTTMTQSETDIAVSSSIDAGKKLVVSAAQDLNTQGAKLATDGDLRASAGHDINLDVAENFSSYATASSKKGMFSSKSSGSSSSQTTVTSTELHGKTLDVQADNDLTLHAAALYAQESAKLSAGRDMEIGTALQQQTSSHYSQSSKFGFNSIGAPNVTQKAQQNQQSSSDSIGTSVSADSLGIKTGRDAVVRGSTLVTDNNLQIDVGRNLAIVSAENTSASSSSSSSKKSGQIGSWWQDAIGVVQLKDGNQSQSTRQAGSQVASLGGDVNLNAAEYYNQIASQVIAPKGDISINAKNVDIQAGYDVLSANHTASSNRTAVGGSIDIPLVDAVRGVQQAVQSSEKTSDPRMQGLAAANAAMSGKQAYEAGQTLMNGGMGGFKVSVNLSNSESHTESSQSGQNVVSSSLAAGGDVNVTASGAGKDSTLNVLGSRIDAGHDINLKSDGDINLLSAQNTATQNGTNGNSGASIGIGFSVGQQNGFTLDLAANKGMGKSDGRDVTQTNTQLKAGNKATLDSGSDTNLKGAVVTANQVQANVGGDLNLSSVQDTSKFSSKQIDASVGVSICIPPFCYGVSGTASLNQQKMNSDYASVSEQTGIKAGDDGFQVDVKGNTSLNGAVIASTDQAVKDGKNSLSTGTLTTSDIRNKAEYDASSIGLSGGVGGDIGRDAKGNQQAGAPGTPVPSNGNVSANAPIALIASGESSSTTQSGISGATVKINDDSKQQALTGQTAAQAIAAINTDVSSDRDGSNKLKPIFNQQEIQAGFDITAKFVQNVGVYLESRANEVDKEKALADAAFAAANDPTLSPEKRQALIDNAIELNRQARDIANDWGAGGTYRQITTALVAGVSGGVTGSTSQFAQNMVVNYVQQQGADYIGKLVLKGDIKEGDPIHTALHAILGCAGAVASSQGCSSGAMGGAASSVLTNLFKDTDPNETQSEREAKRNIITSLVTGIAAGSDPNDAAIANNTATANVDNNWLATQQLVQAHKEMDEAVGLVAKAAVLAKWSGVSVKQDLLTSSGIGLGITQGGLQDVEGLSQFLAHPIEGLSGLASVVSSDEVRAKLGTAAADSLVASIDRMKIALETGGDEQAVQLGRDLGLLIYTVGSVVTGIGGAAKAGVTLAKVGIEVSSKTLGKLVLKDSAELGERVAELETRSAKNLNPGSAITDGEATVTPNRPVISKPEPIKSGVPAIDELSALEPTAGGYVSATKLNAGGYAITDLTATERALAQQVASGVDRSGALTEELVESVSQRQGLQPLDGGKYGSNNGFDHVYMSADGESVILLDSKQINGGISLSRDANDIVQMSDKWVEKVLGSLDKESAAFKAVDKALKNGTLTKGVAGVDRESGQLIIAKLK